MVYRVNVEIVMQNIWDLNVGTLSTPTPPSQVSIPNNTTHKISMYTSLSVLQELQPGIEPEPIPYQGIMLAIVTIEAGGQ